MTERRIVSIFLPCLPMERWMRWMERQGSAPPDDVPLVLAREGTHGPVVHGVNRAAALLGIRAGERVVDMKALCPTLQVEYGDLRGDQALLERLVLWVRRWCPFSVSDGADGLVLDVTGCAHLFGGEAALLRDMEAQFSYLGLTVRLALAPTWGAAWALARYGGVRAICAEDEIPRALTPLPAKALRLTGETVLLLHRLGLKSVGDIAAIPRLSLTRRFARAGLEANPLMRLDQALGLTGEPVSSVEAAVPVRAICRLAEAVQDPTAYVPGLCDEVCAQLEAGGMGARKLHLTVFRLDGEARTVSVAVSRPSRDGTHMARLFEGQLERIDPGFGFDLITLDVGGVEPVLAVQKGLEGEIEDGVHLAHLIDRLTARFGARAVERPRLIESHRPERAQEWTPALAGAGDVAEGVVLERPERVLEPPEEVRVVYAVPEGPPAQFIWRRQNLRVARYAGPERIAPEWWRDRPGTRLRDYYKVEDGAGRRLWLYREGLHEDGRGGEPRWFVHGVFG